MPLYLLCINDKPRENYPVDLYGWQIERGKVYTQINCFTGCCNQQLVSLAEAALAKVAAAQYGCWSCGRAASPPTVTRVPYFNRRRFIQINDPDLWKDLTEESLEELVLAFVESR